MTGQINVNKIVARSGNLITYDSADVVNITLAKGEGTASTNLKQGLNKVWFTLGMDAVQDDSFNCSSVDDDGTGDFGIHFTNAFNNVNYIPNQNQRGEISAGNSHGRSRALSGDSESST